MRKITCLLIALILCLSIAAPVFATESGFVPSITYKPDPEIIPVENENGEEDVTYIGVIRDEAGEVVSYVEEECLDVTPIAHVWNPEVEVPKEVEELLTGVYEELNAGEMEIPYEKFEGANLDGLNMVIRDLFDARWTCEDHNHMVSEEGVTFEITFDLGVVADAQIFVMTYDEATGEWSPIVKSVNNGDGTVTCTFEHLCAVAFTMPMAGTNTPVDDAQAPAVMPWIITMIVTMVAVVIVLVIKGKKKAAA